MQNPIQKFKQSSIVLIKIRNNFCWNFVHVSYLPMSTKVFLGFSIFGLELELFAKIKKDLVTTLSQKPGLSVTQDLNKIRNIPNTLLQGIFPVSSMR